MAIVCGAQNTSARLPLLSAVPVQTSGPIWPRFSDELARRPSLRCARPPAGDPRTPARRGCPMTAYYNEFDPFAAQWLRNLIDAGHIAPGDVDDRSILEVSADDLRGYDQCHFFAGIGLWSLALRWAGWPDDRPGWTGSCPCQPLSSAGQRKGHADERHLWPAFHGLIAERRPPVVFGEQVARKDGREWFAAVRADLEGTGYACGSADLCAAGVGAPHIRQRLFWVADRIGAGLEGHARHVGDGDQPGRIGADAAGSVAASGRTGRLAYPSGDKRGQERAQRGRSGERGRAEGLDERSGDGGAVRRLADAERIGRPELQRTGTGRLGGEENDEWPRSRPELGGTTHRPGPSPVDWRDADWLFCRDGKWRPVEPGTFPLVDGYPARVGVLRAAGNAICPQVAAEFIGAFMEIAADGGTEARADLFRPVSAGDEPASASNCRAS